MPLISCPECKKRISDSVDKCLYCGFVITPERLAEIRKAAAELQHKVKIGCSVIAAIACVFVLYIVFLFVFDTKHDGSTRLPDRIYRQEMAKAKATCAADGGKSKAILADVLDRVELYGLKVFVNRRWYSLPLKHKEAYAAALTACYSPEDFVTIHDAYTGKELAMWGIKFGLKLAPEPESATPALSDEASSTIDVQGGLELRRDTLNLAMKLCDMEKLKQHNEKLKLLYNAGDEAWSGKCYPFGWYSWVDEAVKELLGEEYEQFSKDVGAQSPGKSVLVFPDGQQAVVFSSCRQHDCPNFGAYFLISPKNHDVNVIWKRNKEFVYFGSQDAAFKKHKFGEWFLELEPKL